MMMMMMVDFVGVFLLSLRLGREKGEENA